ncbi:hypothetical protein DR64_8703 [Paraburkholderia xenovorans LB400]|nr:hypothetical protein [Paraburkholderia xenovorans]AIP33894.1 hypothetical protein DR64_8703 [Paraburkholderia xenovorans LB400]
MGENFGKQRVELLGLINSDPFVGQFFAEPVELRASVMEIQISVGGAKKRQQFHTWCAIGETVNAKFRRVGS